MFKLNVFFFILFVSIAQRAKAQNTTDPALIVFNINRPLVLSCNLTHPEINGTQEITWYKNGTHVEDMEELVGRYQLLPESQLFIIERTTVEDHGDYACEFNATTQILQSNFLAKAMVYARLPKNTQLIEGENLWLVCRVFGSDPIVTWILPDGIVISNSTERVQLFEYDAVPNAALEILNVRLDERGNYTCVVNNQATVVNGNLPALAFGMVRVRSHLAPLWPVCGMAVEFFVLFVILYFYEKYRDPDDVDDDSVCDYIPGKGKRN
uniref:Ig-like domain-containing protein n=2 Tax=Nyssomyia neivai TaxID=330878 RepID=A0A1L8D8B4_9DIPT